MTCFRVLSQWAGEADANPGVICSLPHHLPLPTCSPLPSSSCHLPYSPEIGLPGKLRTGVRLWLHRWEAPCLPPFPPSPAHFISKTQGETTTLWVMKTVLCSPLPALRGSKSSLCTEEMTASGSKDTPQQAWEESSYYTEGILASSA